MRDDPTLEFVPEEDIKLIDAIVNLCLCVIESTKKADGHGSKTAYSNERRAVTRLVKQMGYTDRSQIERVVTNIFTRLG